MRGTTLTDGFTECQLYKHFRDLGNLSWLGSFYPELEMTAEDIMQIEGWIKNHPAQCLTGCNTA